MAINKTVLLLSGKMGSGKSQLAENLHKSLNNPYSVCVRTRYAKVLYLMHDACRDIGRQYGLAMPEKFRTLLQKIGTECIRDEVDQDAWVNCLVHEVRNTPANWFVIDDCRFKNEFNLDSKILPTDNIQVLKIRLVCAEEIRKSRCNVWSDTPHQSELDLDDVSDDKFDLVIDTGELNQVQTVNKVLKFLRNKYK